MPHYVFTMCSNNKTDLILFVDKPIGSVFYSTSNSVSCHLNGVFNCNIF